MFHSFTVTLHAILVNIMDEHIVAVKYLSDKIKCITIHFTAAGGVYLVIILWASFNGEWEYTQQIRLISSFIVGKSD